MKRLPRSTTFLYRIFSDYIDRDRNLFMSKGYRLIPCCCIGSLLLTVSDLLCTSVHALGFTLLLYAFGSKRSRSVQVPVHITELKTTISSHTRPEIRNTNLILS